MPDVIELSEAQVEQLRLFEYFCALGLDENDALRLARAGASPSAARSLLRKGCSLELVVEILA